MVAQRNTRHSSDVNASHSRVDRGDARMTTERVSRMSARNSLSHSWMSNSNAKSSNRTARKHAAVARAAAAACEPLEGRRMLSASVVGGQLRVTGTDYA